MDWNNLKELAAFLGIVCIFTGALMGISYFYDNLDAKRAKASEQYITCYQLEYGMSPSAYYNRHGYYGECGKN